ncbi:gamma-glutamyl-gamma-aminobutyrate hydrolase family protein [Streptomyces sp. NPDC088747]|uniref:gamma-glutamyl-gamma-aminobutyrate hydrolase family protein n=1 Tax=Streptomyces sp. NPDC088747 TaxID=3365886 RepID=UPI003828A32C
MEHLGHRRHRRPAVLRPGSDRRGRAVILSPDNRDVDVLDRLHGLLVLGGLDIDPAHFGQARHPATDQARPDRDAGELLLLGRRSASKRMSPRRPSAPEHSPQTRLPASERSPSLWPSASEHPPSRRPVGPYPESGRPLGEAGRLLYNWAMLSEPLMRRLVTDLCRRPGSCCR